MMDSNESSEAAEVINGFGRFLVAIASFLTITTVRKLANVFNYPPARIEEFERDRNPGYVFVMSLRERGIILPNDVSTLVDALKEIDLHGIAYDVLRSFEKLWHRNETLRSPERVNRRVNRPAPDELLDSFRTNLYVSQSSGGLSPNQKAQISSFIESIKAIYRDLYNRVQPIPFIKDRLLCVEKVFVDSGIEGLVRTGVSDVWQRLDSYQCIFSDLTEVPMRCILFGEPGYGKSTLALQLLYDWCNCCPESPLKNVDILIFLRLRELRGVASIFKAIKQFLLPRDSQITQNDIMEILYSSKSVVVLLDGFDEYAFKSGGDDDDVNNIIKGRMFQNFIVIVTTRPSIKPLDMTSTTVQMRLTGFDSEAQDDYIRKTVTESDTATVEKIKKVITDNPIVADLCEVPLFFAMVSHMTCEKGTTMNVESVTGFFRYMIGCFHEHMKNKLSHNELKRYEQLEKNHQKLDKAAFEALTGKNQILWMKEKLQERIGTELYDQYISLGILVEDETVIFNDTPGSPTSAFTERKTLTRFFHKLFCEWYAGHYLSQYFNEILTPRSGGTEGQLDPFELQYVFRFACGINPKASSRILEYLHTLEGGDKFSILCILEQTGKVDNILESIRQICFEGVIISGHDSLLLQRSSFQLLDIAAKHDIPIKVVVLYNCLQSVDLSTAAIRTTSGLALTSTIPVKRLAVSLFNREITEDEAIAILEFSSHCLSLKILWFAGSVPPQSFKVDSTLATLKSRNVKVSWQMFTDDPKYILNLETGRWQGETDGKEQTMAEFEIMRSKFLTQLEMNTDKYNKDQIKNLREYLRKKAEERKSNTK